MDESISKTERFFTWLPVVVFCAVVPLIVYTKHMELSKVVADNWIGPEYWGDIFAYYKSLLIIICAGLSLIMMITKACKKSLKIKLTPVLIAVAAYALLTLLSSIFSEYVPVAFFGAPERFEGALAIISYLVMFIYITSVFRESTDYKYIVFPLIASSSLLLLIGALQFFGFDIYRIDFFMRLMNMIPREDLPYTMTITLPEYTMFSTVFNTNYLGVYVTLLIPVVLAFYASRSKTSLKVAVIPLIYLCFLCLIGNASTATFYFSGLSLLLMIVIGLKHIGRNIVNIALMILAVCCLLLVTDLVTGNRLYSKLRNIDTVSEIAATGQKPETIYIDDIDLSDNSVYIDTSKKDFTVINENKTIAVYEDGRQLTCHVVDEGENDTFPGDIIYIVESGYENYVITTNEEYSVFAVRAAGKIMYFYMTDDGVRVPGMRGKLYDITPIERNEFFYEHGTMFSSRGYIWSGMLPTMRNTVLLGHGPDTFFITYPQEDYIGKINMLNKYNVIVEKAHNMYLQVAHDSGWLALAVILFIFGWYFVETVLIFIKKKPDFISRKYAGAAFCSIIGYLASGLMYDSAVFTAPVFWTLLAMGYALNSIYKKSSAG